jgi:hypothetical protein
MESLVTSLPPDPANGGDGDYPATWRWEVDGPEVDGRFLRFDEGPTVFGVKPIAVLEVGGVLRSVWLLERALHLKFADETARRPGTTLVPGERVVVRRGAMRESAAGRPYRAFTVAFPDRPTRSAAEILGIESAEETLPPGDVEEPLPF